MPDSAESRHSHPSRLAVGRRILQSRATLVQPALIAASLNSGRTFGAGDLRAN